VPETTLRAEVREVWRYPVKSMQGERLQHAEVASRGIAGDREFALVDAATGRTLTAKTIAPLLDARAVHDGDDVVITLPDGRQCVARATATNDVLSAWLQRDVRCERATQSTHASYDMTFDPPDDTAEQFEIPSPEGTFFDLAALHVLTTNALAACADAAPASTWDRRRFRPNLLVEVAADAAGAGANGAHPEDAWVGRKVRAGGMVFDVLMRTVRCAKPLRAQPAHGTDAPLERDVDVYRTMAKVHENHLGVYANVATAGAVAVGDAVAVLAS
jgi:uncharacterized protein YcbX